MKTQTQLIKSKTEYNPQSLNIIKEEGLIKNVVIAQEGLNKNNTYFDVSFLTALVAKAQEQPRGIKARFGHPSLFVNSLGSYIGRYQSFKLQQGPKAKVVANLQLDAICKKVTVPGTTITMWDYILEMATTNHDSFGNSIAVLGTTKSETIMVEGKPQKVAVQQLQEFVASDLVDDPAATESLFFSSAESSKALAAFLENNPRIFDIIQKDETLVTQFLTAYNNFKNEKMKNNTFFSRIKNALNGTTGLELTLANGEIITIATTSGSPQAGDAVTDQNGKPMPNGIHTLTDGSSITTVGGIITEINTEQTPPQAQNFSQQFSALEARHTAFTTETQQLIEIMAQSIATLQNSYNTLAGTVGSGYQVKKDTHFGSSHAATTNTKRTLTFKKD